MMGGPVVTAVCRQDALFDRPVSVAVVYTAAQFPVTVPGPACGRTVADTRNVLTAPPRSVPMAQLRVRPASRQPPGTP